MERRAFKRRYRARSAREFLREAVLTGTAIVVPVLLTVVVLLVGLDVISGLLTPLVIPINEFFGSPEGSGTVATVIAAGTLAALVVGTGALAESDRTDVRIEQRVNAAMARIPGISSIHGTLNQVSEILLESDTDSFQEVVLVEFPGEGSYSVAFKTAEPPDEIREATASDDMITVFMPMGPNPVMGGFILHVRESRVHDVDLSVEEGVSSVVSFGVAINQEDVSVDSTAE